MFILDTDILTLLFSGHARVVSRRDIVPSTEIAISFVTQIEVFRGRFEQIMKAATGDELLRAQAAWDRTIHSLGKVETVIRIDSVVAEKFDQLRANKKLKKIGRADLLIACSALAHDAILVTRNLRHFQLVPGLRLVNWAD
jgi:tRNA(fMet)-specific endonuclease VapC